jgi:Asp-tRNA(Asn)/Glu-tRNA(Gln) amidotransferase A subunit family amidase
MAPTRSAIPYEDLQVLFEQKSLEYAYQRLGELDPKRPALGAVEESIDAKVEGGRRWWKRNGDQVKNVHLPKQDHSHQGTAYSRSSCFWHSCSRFRWAACDVRDSHLDQASVRIDDQWSQQGRGRRLVRRPSTSEGFPIIGAVEP